MLSNSQAIHTMLWRLRHSLHSMAPQRSYMIASVITDNWAGEVAGPIKIFT